eukprot:s4039_g2.t1
MRDMVIGSKHTPQTQALAICSSGPGMPTASGAGEQTRGGDKGERRRQRKKKKKEKEEEEEEDANLVAPDLALSQIEACWPCTLPCISRLISPSGSVACLGAALEEVTLPHSAPALTAARNLSRAFDASDVNGPRLMENEAFRRLCCRVELQQALGPRLPLIDVSEQEIVKTKEKFDVLRMGLHADSIPAHSEAEADKLQNAFSNLACVHASWHHWAQMAGFEILAQYFVNLEDVLKGSKVSFCGTEAVVNFDFGHEDDFAWQVQHFGCLMLIFRGRSLHEDLEDDLFYRCLCQSFCEMRLEGSYVHLLDFPHINSSESFVHVRIQDCITGGETLRGYSTSHMELWTWSNWGEEFSAQSCAKSHVSPSWIYARNICDMVVETLLTFLQFCCQSVVLLDLDRRCKQRRAEDAAEFLMVNGPPLQTMGRIQAFLGQGCFGKVFELQR